ncbi:Transposase for insertion sequence element IS629 [Gluconacetobacter sp. SXCC-1]|nr:Transposase for insertion sequence element IS629 [Gluconacetobacter sp. SXCC-1]
MIAFIEAYRADYGVEPICRVLPIAPSTFYHQAAMARDPARASLRALRDRELMEHVRRIWQDNRAVYSAQGLAQQGGTLPPTDLAIPFFGYKSHISIDRKFRLIRKWKTTDAAASGGARLRESLLDKTNTASTVWADTAYRSKANEDFMDKEGFVSKVHRKKPHLKPMLRHIQRSNAGKSVIRSRIEHVFADQKSQTGLFVRTVRITQATMRIGLANIVYNMRRFLFLEGLNASA